MAENKGFFDTGDGITVGKGISSIRNSRDNRNQLVALFGGAENLPSSIMRAKKQIATEEDDPSVVGRGYDDTAPYKDKAANTKLPKSVRNAYALSGRGCQAGALSRFPQNICRSMVLLYSEPGDTIFDPHIGHNSRMQCCVETGRNYIGCDISTEFMKFNFELAERLKKKHHNRHIELHHCDSRKVPFESEIADFSLTSPPYFDIEYYGDEPEQLGKAKTYEEFLEGMRQVIAETYRVVKKGAHSLWFINDFRRKGKFHLYHIDIIRLGESVGFTTHDIMIVDFGRTMRDAFLNQIIETKILPKKHEFCVIFRKN